MQLKLGNTYKHKTSSNEWKVKLVYFTDLEVCTEGLEIDKMHDEKLLSLFSRLKFLVEFELCN